MGWVNQVSENFQSWSNQFNLSESVWKLLIYIYMR